MITSRLSRFFKHPLSRLANSNFALILIIMAAGVKGDPAYIFEVLGKFGVGKTVLQRLGQRWAPEMQTAQ